MEWYNVSHGGILGKLLVDDSCLSWTPNNFIDQSIKITLFKLAHSRLLVKRQQKLIRVLITERHTFDFAFLSDESLDEYIQHHQTLQREKDKIPKKRGEEKRFNKIGKILYSRVSLSGRHARHYSCQVLRMKNKLKSPKKATSE